jgi:hypothetical protein
MRGSHPEGTDVSALRHLLKGEQTIQSDRGLFLAETWRLCPAICQFTSELFYENRLHSRPGLDRQRVQTSGRFSGSGLRYVGVPTAGNQSSSPEEADVVRDIVEEFLTVRATWFDAQGREQLVDCPLPQELKRASNQAAQVWRLARDARADPEGKLTVLDGRRYGREISIQFMQHF